jgi:hypothetical protein
MKSAFFALLLLSTSYGTALAQPTYRPSPPDVDYPALSFTPHGFGQTFDDAAIALGINVNQRSQLIKCTEEEWTVCSFQVSELAYVIVGGKGTNAPARDVMMVIALAGDNRAAMTAAQGLLDWAALVKILRPDLDAIARSDLIMRFMDAIRENSEDPVEVKSGDVTFSVSKAAGMRIWLSARRS